MISKQKIRNLIVGAVSLALFACGFSAMQKGARAEGTATVDITGGAASYTWGDTAGTYTAAVTGLDTTVTPNEAATGYAWSTDGAVLTGSGTATTFQPTIAKAGAGSISVTVTVTKRDNTTYTINKTLNITVNKATRTISITNHTASIDANSAYLLTSTVSAGASDGTVTWAGTVNNTGTANAIGFSNGSITATTAGAEGSVSGIVVSISEGTNYLAANSGAGVTVNVSLRNPNLTITPATISMNVGESGKTVSASSGAGSTGAISYSVENPNPAGCVSVGATGAVTGAAAGTATVRASIAKAWPYAAATRDATVTVGLATPTTKLTGDVSLPLGGTVTKTVTDKQGGGAVAYSLTNITPAGSITVDAASGLITGVTAGTAKMTFTQAPDAGYAAITAGTFTINVTVAQPALAFNKTAIPINLGATGNVVLTATNVPAGGVINITSSDTTKATVTPATAAGSGSTTFTITGVAAGTSTIKASYMVGATEYKSEAVVTVALPATYFSMYSWYDYLNKSYPKTEVTAIQVNPGNTMGLQADTYWYVENPSVLKLVWSTNACYYENGAYKSRCEVKALRNGTTRVAVRTGNSTVGYTYGYYTITVTGYSYIPQTGPDDTPVFILSGLLAATLLAAAGVVLYQQKKKEMSQRP